MRSRDLFHWERLPVMLYPDEPFDCHGVYSGSALVEDGMLYLYYTGNVKHPGEYDYIKQGRGHNVCLATSRDTIHLDNKRCLMYNQDYPAGLTCHVRDPKVFALDGRYYMVLGARTLDDHGEVLVFESADKLHWNHINTITTPKAFGYMWECPDLFELDGQWFLAVSPQGIACQNVYGCGYFALQGDWRTDCTLSEFHALDDGFDYYAPQSFAAADGRRIQFGWMGMPDADYANPTVEYGWQHCLTIPRAITLHDGRLYQYPVEEMEALRGRCCEIDETQKNIEVWKPFELDLKLDSRKCRISVGDDLMFEADGREACLRLSEKAGAGRKQRKAVIPSGRLKELRMLVDTTAVEIYLNHGEVVSSTRYYPEKTTQVVKLEADKIQGHIYELKEMTGIK